RRQAAPGPALRHLDDPGHQRLPDRDRVGDPRPGDHHRPDPQRGAAVTARRRAGGQAGVTMVEMAVVVALLGLVLAMPVQGLVSYQRAAAAAAADTRQQNLEEA